MNLKGGSAPLIDLLFRLAARIAENRTVAGVHYPVDSAHGAMVGILQALAFTARCEGKKMTSSNDIDLVGDDWAQGGIPMNFDYTIFRTECSTGIFRSILDGLSFVADNASPLLVKAADRAREEAGHQPAP